MKAYVFVVGRRMRTVKYSSCIGIEKYASEIIMSAMMTSHSCVGSAREELMAAESRKGAERGVRKGTVHIPLPS